MLKRKPMSERTLTKAADNPPNGPFEGENECQNDIYPTNDVTGFRTCFTGKMNYCYSGPLTKKQLSGIISGSLTPLISLVALPTNSISPVLSALSQNRTLRASGIPFLFYQVSNFRPETRNSQRDTTGKRAGNERETNGKQVRNEC